MKYHAGINSSDQGAWGHIFELPGCAASSGSVETVEAMLPLVVAEHLAWLRRHGESVPEAPSIEVEVIERVDVAESDAQDGEFCYDDDLHLLTDEDLARGLRSMQYARLDLDEASDGLPDVILDWRPPASAMAHIDPWQPQPLTIREIVRQLPQSEAYYRNCFADGLIGEEPDSIREDLAAQRQRTLEVFRSLSLDDRRRMFLPRTPWGEKPEHWTARKVLRRIIAHERFHTAEIQQRLAWLKLGVPDFRD